MPNRREFLQTGVAVSALPLTGSGLASPGAATGSAVDTSAYVPLRTAIVDERYAEGRAFARELARHGVSTHALRSGDVTDFWYEQLDALWQRAPVAIGGLTQFGPMFVLERLAGERGMRVVLRVEHRPTADGTLAHVISGPREVGALGEQLGRQRLEWPSLSATLATHCPNTSDVAASVTVVTPDDPPVLLLETDTSAAASIIHYYTPQAVQQGHGLPLDGPLFSWVIAPVARSRSTT